MKHMFLAESLYQNLKSFENFLRYHIGGNHCKCYAFQCPISIICLENHISRVLIGRDIRDRHLVSLLALPPSKSFEPG